MLLAFTGFFEIGFTALDNALAVNELWQKKRRYFIAMQIYRNCYSSTVWLSEQTIKQFSTEWQAKNYKRDNYLTFVSN